MASKKYTDISLSQLALQRKVCYAIIFGGCLLMAILITVVGLFFKENVDLTIIVLIVATVISITPLALRLNEINARIKEKESSVPVNIIYSRT